MYEYGDVRGKVSREFNDIKGKALSKLFTYPKGYEAVLYVPERSLGITILNWKGHEAVSPVPIMTIRSNDCTRCSTSHVCNDSTI